MQHGNNYSIIASLIGCDRLTARHDDIEPIILLPRHNVVQEMEEALQDYGERAQSELEAVTRHTRFLEGQIRQVLQCQTSTFILMDRLID